MHIKFVKLYYCSIVKVTTLNQNQEADGAWWVGRCSDRRGYLDSSREANRPASWRN